MGRPRACNPCCDSGGGGTSGRSSSPSRRPTISVPGVCCLDDIGPASWSVTISGVSASNCSTSYCNQWNRTWSPAFVSNCIWTEDIVNAVFCDMPNPIGDENIGIAMRCQVQIPSVAVSTNMAVVFTTPLGSGLFVRYNKAIGTSPYNVDCLTSHTLTKESPPGGTRPCLDSSWPSSIVLSPN